MNTRTTSSTAAGKKPSEPLHVVPIKAIAGVFALTGFAVAIIAGLAAGNTASRVLFVAIIALLVCHIVAVLAGAVLERTVREHLEQSFPPSKPSKSASPAIAGSVGSSLGAPAPEAIGRNT